MDQIWIDFQIIFLKIIIHLFPLNTINLIHYFKFNIKTYLSNLRNPLKKFSKQDSLQYASSSEFTNNSTNPSTSGPLNELEIHIQEMTKLEKECKAILKYTKKLTENITSLNRYQIKISDDLSNSSLCKEYCDNLRVS